MFYTAIFIICSSHAEIENGQKAVILAEYVYCALLANDKS